MKIKGQSFSAWKKWIKKELTDPVVAGPETVYVLEAMYEAVDLLLAAERELKELTGTGLRK